MKYWAHSDPWQPLNEHLRQVGAIAEALAKATKPSASGFHSTAKAVGLLHDIGKYTLEFQRKIQGADLQAPHSAYGAAIAWRAKAVEAAYAISGHHAGLPNRKGSRAGLLERIGAVEGGLDDLRRIADIDCPELLECGELLHAFAADVKASDLRTRMLFSCLVDADRIDSSGDSQTGDRKSVV